MGGATMSQSTTMRPVGPQRGRASVTPSLRPPQSWRQPDRHLENLIGSTWYAHVSRLFDTLNFATHVFFRSRGARFAPVPVTTGAISSPMGLGSDSEPVLAVIGGKPTFLADSMQFMLELAARIEGSPAYYVMPSFRGEEADARHLNQFFHAEVEVLGGLKEVKTWGEGLVLALTRALLEEVPESVEAIAGTTAHLSELLDRGRPFPSISLDEAKIELQSVAGAFEPGTDEDPRITGLGERELIRRFGDFVWLTGLPRRLVPFYQAIDPDRPTRALAADLLAGIGETLGCGQRAASAQDVEANLEFCNVAPGSYDWYVAMKAQAPLATSGFGLGMERFLLWATRTHDIRDWALLIRDRHGQGAP